MSLLELNSAYRGTALVLGDVVEADDGYTGEHCRGVRRRSPSTVAEELGLNAEQRRNLEFGALLHDVGKIAIPKEIVNKPGKLDPDEWQLIKTHTVEGQKMLDRIGGFMHDVGLIVRSHHERWDGGGYPDGLAGEEIPLEARIVDLLRLLERDAHRPCLPQGVDARGGARGAEGQRRPPVRPPHRRGADGDRGRDGPDRPAGVGRRGDPPPEPQPRRRLRSWRPVGRVVRAARGRTVTCSSGPGVALS